MRFTVASWLFLAGLMPGYADVKVVSKYTAEGQTTETTTYAKGERLRYQYSQDVTLLRDCARKQITQVDDKNKTFVSLPDDTGKTVSKLTLTDTGETKEMFQLTAHHMKSSVPAEDGKGRVESDGWYIDSKELPSCAAPGNYPLSYTISTYKDGQAEPTKVTMEVSSLVIAPLDENLFGVPTGYADANKKPEPTVSTKAPGAIRVGAMLVPNKSVHTAPSMGVHDHFLSQMRAGGIDVMPLAGATPEAVNDKAKATQCDYILYTEIASVDKPSTGKMGGLLRKTPGVGKITAGDAMEANVSYRLVPSAGGSPALMATATGRNGSSFNWKNAVTLATTVTPMFMMGRMMTGAFNPTMMNTLATGNGYGAPMVGMDPMMGTMSTALQAARLMSGPPPAPNQSVVDNAVAAAFDQEAKAILAQLKK